MYLLGYLPSHNRIYVVDKDLSIFSYQLSLSVIEYQTSILRGDMQAAEALLPSIPNDQRNRIARFLEQQGASVKQDEQALSLTILSLARVDMKDLALQVTTDVDQKFDLALGLDNLPLAIEIVESNSKKLGLAGNELKWRTLGDRALTLWKIDLAAKCFKNAGDLPALLLVYSSTGDKDGVRELADLASESSMSMTAYGQLVNVCILFAESKGLNNVAFAAYLQLQDTVACVDLLLSTDRIPEAGLFARTYAPSQVSRVVKAWKADLESKKKGKIAAGLADPEEDEELFGEQWAEALALEKDGAAQKSDTQLIDAPVPGGQEVEELVEKMDLNADGQTEGGDTSDDVMVDAEDAEDESEAVPPKTNGTQEQEDLLA